MVGLFIHLLKNVILKAIYFGTVDTLVNIVEIIVCPSPSFPQQECLIELCSSTLRPEHPP